MKTRSAFALLLLFLAACSFSDAQVKRARSAEYKPDATAAVLNAVRAALAEGDYDIAVEDAERGIVVSAWRAYSPDGMAKQKERPAVENGSILFRLAIELGKGPRGGVIVHVVGNAQKIHLSMSQMQPLNPEDSDRPPWVDARADALALAIHERLADVELPAAKQP